MIARQDYPLLTQLFIKDNPQESFKLGGMPSTKQISVQLRRLMALIHNFREFSFSTLNSLQFRNLRQREGCNIAPWVG